MERAEGSSPKKLRGPNSIGPLFSLHSQAQMLERDCDGEIPRDYTNYQGVQEDFGRERHGFYSNDSFTPR